MPDPAELDLKLLDRALERHSAARGAFARDLKIAAALVVAFQFGVFFKFVDLSDRERAIGADLASVTAARTALGDVESGLGALSATLQDGAAHVASDVGSGHTELRRRILAFNQALDRRRHNGVAQSGAPDSLAGLKPDEIALLISVDDPARTQVLFRQVVNATIVREVFDAHNQRKRKWLDEPFDRQADVLAARIAKDRPALALYGWKPADVLSTVEAARRSVHGYAIAPPAKDDWWATVEQKMTGFLTIRGDIERAFAEVGASLAKSQKPLDAMSAKLSALAEDAAKSKAALDGSMAALKERYGEAQKSITDLAKPLSAVSLDAGDVVRYDPVILAAAIIFFLARYLSLRAESEALAKGCRELGYSDRTVSLYFANAPDAMLDAARAPSRPEARAIAKALVLVAPGVLAIVSAARVLASPSLKVEAPTILYAIAIAGLIATYAVLAIPAVRAWSSRPPTLAG